MPAEVSAGAVTDPGGRRQIEVDVAVLGPGLPGEALTSQAAADQRILLAGLDRLYG